MTSQSFAPTRVQRRRTRGWRLPPNTVIVDRTSRWGNPFTVASAAEAAAYQDPQKAVVTDFDAWLTGDNPLHEDVYEVNGRRFDRRWMRQHLHELTGQNLCCPCSATVACHVDVLLRVANTPHLVRRLVTIDGRGQQRLFVPPADVIEQVLGPSDTVAAMPSITPEQLARPAPVRPALPHLPGGGKATPSPGRRSAADSAPSRVARGPWHGNPIRDPSQLAPDDIVVSERDGIRWRVTQIQGESARSRLVELEPVDNPGCWRCSARHLTRLFAVHRDGSRRWSRVPPARIAWPSSRWHEQVVLPVHRARTDEAGLASAR